MVSPEELENLLRKNLLVIRPLELEEKGYDWVRVKHPEAAADEEELEKGLDSKPKVVSA